MVLGDFVDDVFEGGCCLDDLLWHSGCFRSERLPGLTGGFVVINFALSVSLNQAEIGQVQVTGSQSFFKLLRWWERVVDICCLWFISTYKETTAGVLTRGFGHPDAVRCEECFVY